MNKMLTPFVPALASLSIIQIDVDLPVSMVATLPVLAIAGAWASASITSLNYVSCCPTLNAPWRVCWTLFITWNHKKKCLRLRVGNSTYYRFSLFPASDLLLDNNLITCNHSACLLSANSFQGCLSSRFSVKHSCESCLLTDLTLPSSERFTSR